MNSQRHVKKSYTAYIIATLEGLPNLSAVREYQLTIAQIVVLAILIGFFINYLTSILVALGAPLNLSGLVIAIAGIAVSIVLFLVFVPTPGKITGDGKLYYSKGRWKSDVDVIVEDIRKEVEKKCGVNVKMLNQGDDRFEFRTGRMTKGHLMLRWKQTTLPTGDVSYVGYEITINSIAAFNPDIPILLGTLTEILQTYPFGYESDRYR
jgi:hypothetical protein